MFAFVSHTHFMVKRSAKNHQLSQNFYQLKFEIPLEVGTGAPSGYSFQRFARRLCLFVYFVYKEAVLELDNPGLCIPGLVGDNSFTLIFKFVDTKFYYRTFM